jgi:hypothetical protein
MVVIVVVIAVIVVVVVVVVERNVELAVTREKTENSTTNHVIC